MKLPYQANLVKEYVNLRKRVGDNPTPAQSKKLRKLEKYMERTV